MAEPVTDAFIGGRVRAARQLRGLSQAGLAERAGVSFQQIQKYEKGLNRLSSGMLYRLALCVELPIHFFFEDAEPAAYPRTSHPVPDRSAPAPDGDPAIHQESLVFWRYFRNLRDDQRERLGDLIVLLASQRD